MPVTVIVGGQFGSEGKGKVAHYFAREKRASIAIRVGGPNSGHTVIDPSGRPLVLRMLPTAAILPDTICVLSAGSYIDIDVLYAEIRQLELRANRLIIDPNAYVVTEEHKGIEATLSLGERIGSTQSGLGAALADRVMRRSNANLAKNDPRLAPFVAPVRQLLRSRLDRGENIILEGTQGFGLSLLHSPEYPKATSRDTTAGTFLGEVGISPLDVDDIVVVIRAFPIRVSGDSGDLPNETTWDEIAREGGWTSGLVERTSVTKKVRRVGRFDAAIVRAALMTNSPTKVVLNHVDYFDVQSAIAGCATDAAMQGVMLIERTIDRTIDLIGLGPALLVPRYSATRQLMSA